MYSTVHIRCVADNIHKILFSAVCSDPAALSALVGGAVMEGKENCPSGSAALAHQ